MFLLLLLSCAPPAPPPLPASSSSVVDEIHTLADLINRQRKAIGCSELVWLETVARVAQKHSDDMVRRNFFDHTNPDGAGPFERLDKANLRYSKAAENIAYGQPTAEAVFSSWMSSAGHRANIEDCSLSAHGIGLTRGTKSLPYGVITNAWTHDFIAPRN